MKVLIAFLFLIMGSVANANHKKGTHCYNVRDVATSYCNASNVECSSMGACLVRRNQCPGDITNKSGCEAFNECISDTSPYKDKKHKRVSRIYLKNACEYTWQPGGYCRLYNTPLEFITYGTCPGRRAKAFKDEVRSYECEVARDKLKEAMRQCKEARATYDKECRKTEGYKKISFQKYYSDCPYADQKTTSTMDTIHKGDKSTDDSGRDKYKAAPKEDEGAGGNGSKGRSTDK